MTARRTLGPVRVQCQPGFSATFKRQITACVRARWRRAPIWWLQHLVFRYRKRAKREHSDQTTSMTTTIHYEYRRAVIDVYPSCCYMPLWELEQTINHELSHCYTAQLEKLFDAVLATSKLSKDARTLMGTWWDLEIEGVTEDLTRAVAGPNLRSP